MFLIQAPMAPLKMGKLDDVRSNGKEYAQEAFMSQEQSPLRPLAPESNCI